uniref:SUI1 domain-containing protein n=1 Tax=Pseudictyota dubia TaxID=2749911 RepID=A0A7R9W360_9STRA|mmetsp:Transcript_301/g.322  ORF Transcript_301/g.322 Transcript_301/m.322 type:complete len:260 (+) Transcript_301:80-859(+)|eukprot:CAMPEP_0197450120 /NCGR_PEP_ID=MMETSP1175-20131217/24076_1 /TAXON_ID=1003142 /ORGANISM="Triceratium dubium, Strain CCMP147" /LENGTH=259 /DNA_ID=CAMNT_0042982465 /DNA_START=63 /DNA_END=842 /DNA_ORIENTATION=-
MAATEARTVLYCGQCGMPPEYCEYGPDFESHCNPWLLKNHPDLYARLKDIRAGKSSSGGDHDSTGGEDAPSQPWTTEERLCAFYEKYQPDKVDGVPALLEKYAGKENKLFAALVKKYGPEPEDPYLAARHGDESDSDAEEDMAALSISDKKKRRGVGAKKTSKMDTRVVIQKISRNKKKAVTIVVGMDTVPDVKLKDVSKAFSKRFAGSSSVKDTAGGGKEIIIQGDHCDDVAAMIVNKFKVPADSVFLDIDGEFVPFR